MIKFIDSYDSVISFFGQVGTILIALLTVFLWLEAIFTRIGTIKPILIPYRTEKIQTTDRLFVFNFSYPISDDRFNHFGIAYLGLKNIGKGPACDVKVELFKKSNGEKFCISENIINIAEDSVIPLIIRIGYKDYMEDLEYSTFIAKITYTDILRKRYFLEVEIWLKDFINNKDIVEATAIRYKNFKKPRWRKFDKVVFREVENFGYWELLKIKKSFR